MPGLARDQCIPIQDSLVLHHNPCMHFSPCQLLNQHLNPCKLLSQHLNPCKLFSQLLSPCHHPGYCLFPHILYFKLEYMHLLTKVLKFLLVRGESDKPLFKLYFQLLPTLETMYHSQIHQQDILVVEGSHKSEVYINNQTLCWDYWCRKRQLNDLTKILC